MVHISKSRSNSTPQPSKAPRCYQQFSPPSSKPGTPMSPSDRDLQPSIAPPKPATKLTAKPPTKALAKPLVKALPSLPPQTTTLKLPPKRPRSPTTADNLSLRKRRRASFLQTTPRIYRSPLIRRRRSDGPDLLRQQQSKKAQPRRRLSVPPPTFHSPPPREVSFLDSTLRHDSASEAEEFADLLREGFTFHEASLFQKIRKRGLKPLMPAHWQVDFATIPDHLFTLEAEGAWIEAVELEGTFNATCAFRSLVCLGTAVRSRVEVGREVESVVVAGLRRYVQWSVEDAKFAGFDIRPLIALSSSQSRGPDYCEQRMDKKMRILATSLYTEESRLKSLGNPVSMDSSGTIYGLAVSGCVVALLTLNARVPNADWRTLLVVDFSDATLDFWNAVGIALLVIAAREDEIERVEFYNRNEVERGKIMVPWQGKQGDEEDDEDA